MAKFPTTARIHQAADFYAAFSVKPRRSSHFSIYVRENGLGQARLGLVIGKKFYKHAVHRNLIRRIAREIFREHLPTLKAADILLRLHRKFVSTEITSLRELKSKCFLEISSLIAHID